MTKKVKFLIAVVFSCALTCCSSNSSSTPPNNNPPTNPGTASISPTTADLLTGQSQQFSTQITGDVVWSVNGVSGGNSTVGTVDSSGKYTAPAAQPSAAVTVKVASSTTSSFSASAKITVVGSGTVTATANPQVATYTVAPPVAANVTIQFGTGTTYGFTTSTQQATGSAAPLAIFVAGMKGNTQYHMRAVFQLSDGNTLNDTDHTFTTGALNTNQVPLLTVNNPNGMTPQSGVEMLDLIQTGTLLPVVASDLAGNVIWSYNPGGTAADIVQPIKLLPNGHFVLVIAPSSADPINGTSIPAGTLDVVREIDLAGNTIREISVDTLNSRLATAGFNYTADIIHHDIAILPNGHWILLVNSVQQVTLTGATTPVSVLGDALIDLDQNLNPVWMWNTFDHLDVNRQPYMFPDWTHSNAILYSATDGNLILSIRHQNWLIKIDYNNGKGAGDIIWHLGEGGDFTLVGGTDPTDWFYAQHGPSFTSSTTAGTYGLTVFDNGDDRMFPGGETCQMAGAALCPYSTVATLTLDETAKTATFAFHDILSNYSFFGGNAETLANGNVEFDLCASNGTTPDATAFEVTPDNPAQTVWQLNIPGVNAYRVFRMGSLYPGVNW